jgi:hypothetical protein
MIWGDRLIADDENCNDSNLDGGPEYSSTYQSARTRVVKGAPRSTDAGWTNSGHLTYYKNSGLLCCVEEEQRKQERKMKVCVFARRPILLGVLLSATVAPSARAQPARTQKGSKPLELRIVTGLSLGLNGAGVFGRTGVEQLYHFSGHAHGPALGGLVQGYYFARPNINGGGIAAGPMFAWDIRLAKALGLYLSPAVAVGYGLLRFDSANYHFIDIQMGATLRLVLNDSWEINLRPLHFDLLINDGVIAFYDGGIGVGYNF